MPKASTLCHGKAREWAVKHRSWEKATEKIVKVMEEVVR